MMARRKTLWLLIISTLLALSRGVSSEGHCLVLSSAKSKVFIIFSDNVESAIEPARSPKTFFRAYEDDVEIGQ